MFYTFQKRTSDWYITPLFIKERWMLNFHAYKTSFRTCSSMATLYLEYLGRLVHLNFPTTKIICYDDYLFGIVTSSRGI